MPAPLTLYVDARFRSPYAMSAHVALAEKQLEFEVRLLDLFCWLSFVNYLGLPAIVFPIGRDAAGRPISVQAIARPGGEAMLLALARQAGHSRFGGRGFAQQPGLPLARSRERV